MRYSDRLRQHDRATRYKQMQSEVLHLKERLPPETITDIVHEVLQRVIAEHGTPPAPINHPSDRKVKALCYALISDDPTEGAAFIHNIRDDGADLDAIYLNYLAEAATLLGTWWTTDHVTFHEVTIASSRIYAIIREYSHLFVPHRPVEVKSAVFAAVPGEIHTLGVLMAADLFRKEGWRVDVKTGRPHDALLAEITASPCRIVGLSAGGLHSAPALAQLVIALRISRPDLRIFLSGQITHEGSNVIKALGLDGVASDVKGARDTLQQLWSQVATPATTG
ncbi:cobalamin B12-binding domain-containing protein [Roseobacter sp.]|uniref:cobalamin B12-binding domain-containing protein n=1 Tax=Roseobacter sp. TaxID=1907202 RepID=UPI003296F34B